MPASRSGRNASVGLVDALALLDERGGHVLDAQPQRAAAGFADQRQVLLHLQRVVDRDLGVPARPVAKRDAVELRAGEVLDDVERAGLVVEEVVVGAEEDSAGRTPC